jgi:hypothetical protein
VADGEAEADALADGLGGEEGVEDALDDVGGDAGARVADLDHDAVALLAGDHADAVIGHVALGDGLRGVHQEVEEHLAEARLVGHHRGHGAELPHQARAVADLVPRHVDARLDDVLDQDGAAPVFVAAGEGAEVLHDLADALGALAGVGQRPAQPRARLGRGVDVRRRGCPTSRAANSRLAMT